MARLLSVNVGLPREIEWRGRIVRTAIWKEPIQGRRGVKRLNVEGDGQADLGGHGGEQRAVFVYQIESYRYWEERLGRHDLTHGQFGENFTIEGLPDDEECIGDRYRIGTALFEVTQPRVTCYRVGIRTNEPHMAALLTCSRRTEGGSRLHSLANSSCCVCARGRMVLCSSGAIHSPDRSPTSSIASASRWSQTAPRGVT